MIVCATNMTDKEVKSFIESFDINPITGKVYWAIDSGNYHIGEKAGSSCSDRVSIVHNGFRMFRYQLIFAYVNGYVPNIIDHKDRNKLNDKINNLRDVNNSLNSFNRCEQKNNTSKITGVVKTKYAFSSRIGGTKNRVELYYGNDFFEACCARKSAEIKHKNNH